jgi:hypothetical protein
VLVGRVVVRHWAGSERPAWHSRGEHPEVVISHEQVDCTPTQCRITLRRYSTRCSQSTMRVRSGVMSSASKPWMTLYRRHIAL